MDFLGPLVSWLTVKIQGFLLFLKYFFGLTWIRQGRIGGCSPGSPQRGVGRLTTKKNLRRALAVYARYQNVISKALKFDSKYQIRPGPIRPSPVSWNCTSSLPGYIGTDRNSVTVGRIFQFREFLAGFLLFEWLHLKLEIFFLDLKSTENSYNNQNPPYWIPCSCL